MPRTCWLLVSASAAAILGGVYPAYSQVGSTARATSSQAPQATQIQEVIVTANKREQNVNRVGLTVQALSGATLQQRQIVSLADVANAVPGLSFSQSFFNTPVLTLRGIGFDEASLGVYPAVSAYLDQAPLPFPVMVSHQSYDLQRVEVVKGPQGTLYGENATGGAINFVSQRGSDTPAAGGDITYGRFNQVSGDAYVSGPITDNLVARLAVNGLRADGWQDSVTRPGDHNGAQGYVAGRLVTDWRPTDRVHVSLDVNAWLDKSQPYAAQFVGLVPQVLPAKPPELTYPFAPQTPQAADWNPLDPPFSNRVFAQTALRVDIKITDDITLTSLTSYDSFSQRQNEDEDGTSLNLTTLPIDSGHLSSFNQEVRLANSASSRARWVVGGNVERSITYENQLLQYPGEANDNAAHLFLFENGEYNTQNILNYAVFGNLEFDVLPEVTLKGGVRYTSTRDTGLSCTYDAGDGRLSELFNLFGEIFSGGAPFTPVGTTGPTDMRCVSLNAQNVPSLIPFQSTLAQNNVAWHVGVDYRVNNDTTLYANVSRGYKAGSFPETAALTSAEYVSVSQESVLAYEAGVKKNFFDRRVHLDLAGFYYDYSDKQVDGTVETLIFGPLGALVNVPKSRVDGFDADLSVIPFPGMTVGGAVTYLDTDIEQYTGTSAFGTSRNFAGVPLPFSPHWSYTLNADYRASLPNLGGTAFIGISVGGKSRQDTTIGGSAIPIPIGPDNRALPGLVFQDRTAAYALVDLRAGYEAPNDRWSLTVWGKNVFNKYYWNAAGGGGDTLTRIAGFPATYGVTLAFKYW